MGRVRRLWLSDASRGPFKLGYIQEQDCRVNMSQETLPSPPPKPVRAVSPRLRVVLVIVLALFSLLTANGLYLSTITFLQWWKGVIYENYFYQLMFLLHLVLGFLIIVPVISFGCSTGMRLGREETKSDSNWLCVAGSFFRRLDIWGSINPSWNL